jgi:hypothetical protein
LNAVAIKSNPETTPNGFLGECAASRTFSAEREAGRTLDALVTSRREIAIVTQRSETLGRLLMRAAPLLNAPVAALANSPLLGRLVNRNIAMLTYSGRRSGRSFTIPVAHRHSGADVIIAANMPEAKTWSRNFLDDGGPLTLHLDGTERGGHAVAKREEKERVTVTVRLTD